MRIMITRGAEKFSPVQYHLFEVGPFSTEVDIPDGEDPSIKIQAARAWLEAVAKSDFDTRFPQYLDRIRLTAEAVRTSRGGK